MNTELVEVSQTRKEIRIEIAPDEVRQAYDNVSRKFADKADVPGFRKGMAPLDVIRMRFKEEIKSDVLQELLPGKVADAIREHELQPISEPQLHLEDAENAKVNGSQPIMVHAHVEIMPEVPEPAYEGLEATRRVRPVSEEEIEGVIDERRQQNSTMIPVEDRKSKEGDVVIADLKGTFLDDEDADPIEVNDLEVNLGDGIVEEAFTENLVGVEEDDEREFTVEYPEEFSSAALAGRKVKYHAKIKSVGQVELPEADDEWVASLDEGFESLADLKKQLRQDLEAMSKADADGRVRNELIATLIEKHEFEVPEALVNSQAQTLLNNFAQDLAQRGVDLTKVEQSFIESTYNQMKVQASRDVQGAMLLEKIAENEDVDVTDEEVDKEIESMAGYYQVTEDQMMETIEQQGGKAMVSNNLRTRKAVEALVVKAKVTDAEWVEEENEPADVAEPVDSEASVSDDEGQSKKKEKSV
ncbi:MAG: trigger factor [Pyrinomonadaceae bacterium]|nr:trigger factor [Pyrinomonadaceae bacterium]